MQGRQAWREELTTLIDDLTRLAGLERARLEVVLGGAAPAGATVEEGTTGVAS